MVKPAPTATAAGLLFPATSDVPEYLSRTDHRNFAAGDRNKWAKSCPPPDEYVVFADAHLAVWRDSRPQLWGIAHGLRVLGSNGEQLAKFPDPSNATDAWHGYPVSARDPRREWVHRPEPTLVQMWVDAGLIDQFDGSRIRRGKV